MSNKLFLSFIGSALIALTSSNAFAAERNWQCLSAAGAGLIVGMDGAVCFQLQKNHRFSRMMLMASAGFQVTKLLNGQIQLGAGSTAKAGVVKFVLDDSNPDETGLYTRIHATGAAGFVGANGFVMTKNPLKPLNDYAVSASYAVGAEVSGGISLVSVMIWDLSRYGKAPTSEKEAVELINNNPELRAEIETAVSAAGAEMEQAASKGN